MATCERCGRGEQKYLVEGKPEDDFKLSILVCPDCAVAALDLRLYVTPIEVLVAI